jgi:DNA-binding MarR family transcriptional regulator
MQYDHVDIIASQWKKEMEELDVAPMAVIGRISRLAGHLDKFLQANYSKFSLHGGEFDVLASLRRSGKPYQLTPTELYSSLMITSGTITNRLDRLERVGLISRFPNPQDRRGTLVRLTGKGKTLMDAAYPAHIAYEEELLQALDGTERETLVLLLRKLLLSYEDRTG